jgi:hypothetical protein
VGVDRISEVIGETEFACVDFFLISSNRRVAYLILARSGFADNACPGTGSIAGSEVENNKHAGLIAFLMVARSLRFIKT